MSNVTDRKARAKAAPDLPPTPVDDLFRQLAALTASVTRCEERCNAQQRALEDVARLFSERLHGLSQDLGRISGLSSRIDSLSSRVDMMNPPEMAAAVQRLIRDQVAEIEWLLLQKKRMRDAFGDFGQELVEEREAIMAEKDEAADHDLAAANIPGLENIGALLAGVGGKDLGRASSADLQAMLASALGGLKK